WRGGLLGTILSIAGGSMAYRAATGHCHLYDAAGINTAENEGGDSRKEKSPYNKSLAGGRAHVTKSILINKSPAQIYDFWRDFENLQQFMSDLESVTTFGAKRSQ